MKTEKMSTYSRLVRMSLALGVITIIGLIASALAMSDIYHHASDLTLEWNTVKVSFLVTLMFVAMSSVTILKLRNR